MHEIIREMADDDRDYDPWGAGMTALGAVCDVLAVNGEPVPASAGYSPGAGGPHIEPGDYWAETLLVELENGAVDVQDLDYAARILSRYLDWVRLAGRDY